MVLKHIKIFGIGLIMLLPVGAFPFDPQLDFPARIDRGSRFCLGCHDGTLARNIIDSVWGKFTGQTPVAFCRDKGHPIEIDYRRAQIASRGLLKDPFLIDPATKLENGLVGCTSCHSPDSQLPAKLVMSNGGSRLCFSCHNL